MKRLYCEQVKKASQSTLSAKKFAEFVFLKFLWQIGEWECVTEVHLCACMFKCKEVRTFGCSLLNVLEQAVIHVQLYSYCVGYTSNFHFFFVSRRLFLFLFSFLSSVVFTILYVNFLPVLIEHTNYYIQSSLCLMSQNSNA